MANGYYYDPVSRAMGNIQQTIRGFGEDYAKRKESERAHEITMKNFAIQQAQQEANIARQEELMQIRGEEAGRGQAEVIRKEKTERERYAEGQEFAREKYETIDLPRTRAQIAGTEARTRLLETEAARPAPEEDKPFFDHLSGWMEQVGPTLAEKGDISSLEFAQDFPIFLKETYPELGALHGTKKEMGETISRTIAGLPKQTDIGQMGVLVLLFPSIPPSFSDINLQPYELRDIRIALTEKFGEFQEITGPNFEVKIVSQYEATDRDDERSPIPITPEQVASGYRPPTEIAGDMALKHHYYVVSTYKPSPIMEDFWGWRNQRYPEEIGTEAPEGAEVEAPQLPISSPLNILPTARERRGTKFTGMVKAGAKAMFGTPSGYVPAPVIPGAKEELRRRQISNAFEAETGRQLELIEFAPNESKEIVDYILQLPSNTQIRYKDAVMTVEQLKARMLE